MKYALFLTLLLLPMVVFAQDTTGFVPLTNTPFTAEAGNNFSLDEFLNDLYRLAIGVAAVVAVIQIMRAGIMYMGGDSVTEKKEAKNLIGLSIGGLILVLSPVVVFSIINPDILDLKIDRLGELGTELERFETGSVVVPVDSEEECTEQGGTVVNQGPPMQCRVPRTNEDGTGFSQQCQNYQVPNFSPVVVQGSSCRVNPDEEYVVIDNSCCAGIQEGSVCCGLYRPTGENEDDTTGDDTGGDQPSTADAEYGYRIAVSQSESGTPYTLVRFRNFTTVNQCTNHMNSYISRNNYTVSGAYNGPLCNCNSPLSQQEGCSNL